MNVLPSDTHSEISHKIQRAFEEHFWVELKRPELLNRVGQNIVVFDFLTPSGMSAIFDTILQRVIRTLQSEQGIQITFEPDALTSLKQLCTQDYFDSGRGIANRIETHLINTLARHLFLAKTRHDVHVSGVEYVDGRAALRLEETQWDGAPEESCPSSGPLSSSKNTVRRVYPSREQWRERFKNT